MTAEDRAALGRPGFMLYENGMGVSAAWLGGDGPSDMANLQVVRVAAEDEDDARRRVIEALGRTPEALRVHTGQ
jgi:hypothetical protein